MSRRASMLIGLAAQSASNGTHQTPTVVRTSAPRSVTCPETLPHRLLPLKGRKGSTGTTEYLGVSVRSVWRLVEAGHLHPIRLPGLRRVAFDVRELDALIEASR